ncbi:hypothetical protein ACFY2R_28835 [Micromonospora olivasterospora]|uniref:Uncharacterized protein n=1 Tax=Micromonospora olivasterospora TaxID=1880 RepID=A0A562IJP6_MICOL|nr:hypothetical protein [Micromonospora olivasterospora]TWH71108.1 hypothetical protein JD77_06133 [Micromonospora olivasterospora]
MSAQPWTFGPVGDLAWQHFPEAREQITDLVCDALQRAIDADRMPQPVDQFEYATHAVGPLTRDLGLVDLDRDLVRRFCLFCRDLLGYSGPDAFEASYALGMYVLHGLDGPPVVRVIRQVDPGLIELVRARFPGTWAEE